MVKVILHHLTQRYHLLPQLLLLNQKMLTLLIHLIKFFHHQLLYQMMLQKIGMTRRLDPQERVDELGDASVPFKFDVHAMIFSDDAPKLEAALHKAFEDKKVNMVNQRREFFNVTLDEIKEVIRKNFDKTVEFIDVPDAEQYRISQKMKCS